MTPDIIREHESIIRNIIRKHETKLGRPFKIEILNPEESYVPELIACKTHYNTPGDPRGPMWIKVYFPHCLLVDRSIKPKDVVSFVGRMMNQNIDWFIEHFGVKPGEAIEKI